VHYYILARQPLSVNQFVDPLRDTVEFGCAARRRNKHIHYNSLDRPADFTVTI